MITRNNKNNMVYTRAVIIHSCHDPIRFDSVRSQSDRFDPIHYPFVQTNTTKISNSECHLNDLLNKITMNKITMNKITMNKEHNIHHNTSASNFFTKLLTDSRRLKWRTSSCQLTPVQGSHSFKFKHLQANCDSYRFSFFPATISSWNNLPFGMEKVDSVEGFKLKLKEHTIRSPWSESNICVILNLESCQLTIRIRIRKL